MASHVFDNMPMWRGWIFKATNDILPKHIVGYMENIDVSPTPADVVQKTLLISQEVAKECQGLTEEVVTCYGSRFSERVSHRKTL